MFRAVCSRLIRSSTVARRGLAESVGPPRRDQHQSQAPSSSIVWGSAGGNSHEAAVVEEGDDESALSEDVLTEQEVEKLIASLRKLEDTAPIVGSGLVKDPTKRLTLSEMTSPDDTTSHEPSRWRKPIYTEGELDSSDLSKPPSRTNPHPFDPSLPEIAASLPPTHARSMAAYANHSKVLQNLLDLG
uniref:Uncharacterized protein n=1 Tax=Panagrellus redivivus TaxID=6233 RepID=A0A7E4UVD5_PANRE